MPEVPAPGTVPAADPSPRPHALIALGANLGRPAATLRAAVRALEALGTVERRSRMYETEPVGGPPDQPPYRNAVVTLRPLPDLVEPEDLLAGLKTLEARFGRERRVRWAARTLDLDLLAVDDRVVNEEGLVLPHPRMLERPFVLVPLLDVVSDWCDPRSGRCAREALRGLPTEGVRPDRDGWSEG